MRALVVTLCSLALIVDSALALVGKAPRADDNFAQAIVGILGARDDYCTATAIARDLLLTAAHCVNPGIEYRLQYWDQQASRNRNPIAEIVRHPQFDLRAMLATGATADLALIRLSKPLPPEVGTAKIGLMQWPIWPGDTFTIIGGGVTEAGDRKSAGIIRTATLIATPFVSAYQIRLVDPTTQGARSGLGACTGDSGSPIFQAQGDTMKVVAIVSWATGPDHTPGCGGVTGATPLLPYRQWIVETARNLGIIILL
jgi:hypothetical protein